MNCECTRRSSKQPFETWKCFIVISEATSNSSASKLLATRRVISLSWCPCNYHMLKQTCSNCQILTKKPLINLLHTTMLLILFIYYDCTRNYSPWRLDANLMVLFFFFIFNWQVMTPVLLFLLWLIGHSINPIRQGIQRSCILESTPWIPSSRYSVLDSRSLSVELGFWISIFRGILDSKSQDSGILPTPKKFPNMGTFDVQGSFKMFAADRTKHVIGRAHIRRVALLLLHRCWWPI